MTDLATNVFSYGDNLAILGRYLPDAGIDLVELDPLLANWAMMGPTGDRWVG